MDNNFYATLEKDKLSSDQTSANSSFINEQITQKNICNSSSSFSEDFVLKSKQLSDTTSVLSDKDSLSKDNYSECESSDSDTRSIRSMKNFNRNKDNRFSNMQAEYPKELKEQRSKSQRFKKRYTEQIVVNEENNEEENESEHPVRRKRLDFSSANYNDDLPSKFKKSKSKIRDAVVNSSFKSRLEKIENINSLSMNFDTVVEDREEEKDNLNLNTHNIIRGLSLGLNSPRVLFMTDNTEDSTIMNGPISNLHVNKDYNIDEVITEDYNENFIEEIKKPLRGDKMLHKGLLMEGVVDKEENILLEGLMSISVNVNGVDNLDFEPIKEENGEEDDKESNLPKLKHNKSSKCK